MASANPKAEAVRYGFAAAEHDVVRRMKFVLQEVLYRCVLSSPELVRWMNCFEVKLGFVAHETLRNVAKGHVVLVMCCHNS